MLTFLAIVLVFIVLVALSQRPGALPRPRKLPEDGLPSIKVTLSTGVGTLRRNPGERKWAPPRELSAGVWSINPDLHFALTFERIDAASAQHLRTMLDGAKSDGLWEHRTALIGLIAEKNPHWRELEEYLVRFRPAYQEHVESLKRSSPEWASASEADRDDLLASFQHEAIAALDVQPDCNLAVLLEGSGVDEALDDALVARYGFDNLETYLRYASYARRVFSIAPDDRDRKRFETLVQAGLAVRGADIPLPAILETLRLKDMAELVHDLTPPTFRRKAQAIEYLGAVPDIRERLGKKIALRALFMLAPLPPEFAHIDAEALGRSWSFTGEVASLLAGTYSAGVDAAEQGADRDDSDVQSMIEGWELVTFPDTSCPLCRRAAKRYRSSPPLSPLHIGCRCRVNPVFGEVEIA